MVATVLLIGFTVAVAGLVSVWLTSFTKTSTGTIEEQGTKQITCNFGGIALSSLTFSNTYLSGNVENTGTVDVGQITLQILNTSAMTNTTPLCSSGAIVFSCSSANLSLSPGVRQSFNISAGATKASISTVRVYTNCSNVDDEASGSEIS